MESVTVKTITPGSSESRNVTLWLNRDNSITLLGNLLHNTTIIIDQALVNDLQALVDYQKQNNPA
jgi:hypothetical protein